MRRWLRRAPASTAQHGNALTPAAGNRLLRYRNNRRSNGHSTAETIDPPRRLAMLRIQQPVERSPGHRRRHAQQQRCTRRQPPVADAACEQEILPPVGFARRHGFDAACRIGNLYFEQLVAVRQGCWCRGLQVHQRLEQRAGRTLGQTDHRPPAVVPAAVMQHAAGAGEVGVVADAPEDQARKPWTVLCSQFSTACLAERVASEPKRRLAPRRDFGVSSQASACAREPNTSAASVRMRSTR